MREEIALILTNGVHYEELLSDVHEEGAMSPQFGPRWASDVLREIEKIEALITTSNKALLQDVREQIPLPEVADMSQHHRDGVNYAADRMKAALDKIAKERGLV